MPRHSVSGSVMSIREYLVFCAAFFLFLGLQRGEKLTSNGNCSISRPKQAIQSSTLLACLVKRSAAVNKIQGRTCTPRVYQVYRNVLLVLLRAYITWAVKGES